MNYELYKELQKAGFPLNDEILHEAIIGNEVHQIGYCFPTLSGLIEACGGQFNGLIQKGEKLWFACGGEHRGFYGDDFIIQGSTPEEAVANLWLELNKKND